MLDIKKIIKALRILNAVDMTKALELSVNNSATTNTKTTVESSQTANRTLTLPDVTDTLTANDATQTLTNKTIDADDNTLLNIDDDEIRALAGIDATKIADGSVDNTEYQYLDGVLSPIQDQIDSKASDTTVTNHISATSGVHGVTGNVVGTTDTQTLTNKTIDADLNTLSNIENADIKALAAIDATKIADGSVDNTEFQTLDGVTSDIQPQIDSKVNRAGDTMTGTLTLNADPVSALQAATKQYVDSISAGLDPKEAVRVATAADLSATYATTPSNGRFTGVATVIDGETLNIGDRVLVRAQTDAKENGIYVYDAVSQLTRSADMDGTPSAEVSSGNYTFATDGAANAGKGYVVLGNGILTLNTDNITWSQFSSAGGGGGTGTRTIDMKLNGEYGGASAQNAVDGFWVAPTDCQITYIFMYNEVSGSSGTTELDIKVKPFGAGSFTTIFSTTPKITSAAAASTWVGIGDTVTGATAPVLSSNPFLLNAKDALRMDLISAQAGAAEGCGIIIGYEEI